MPSLVGSLADNDDTNNPVGVDGSSNDLVEWIMSRVNRWRDDRDSVYEKVWGEYYRLWRGRHIDEDKTRSTERSKLVSPALAQAFEMTVAELEEATFGRDAWVDLIDDVGDPDHADIDGIRRLFLDDMATDKVPEAIASCYTHGGLWGTMAAKIVVDKQSIPTIEKDLEGKTIVRHEPRISVRVVPIPPMELIPDPDAEYIEDMLGIAHEVTKPRAWLLSQAFGREYAAATDAIPNHDEDKISLGDPEALLASQPNQVLVTEYHGLVPKRLLPRERVFASPDEDPLAAAEIRPEGESNAAGELDGDGEMVEAIVTIFDKKYLGRALENPFLMKDRSIVAAPFERVPGRFWGRGVMEKGYNPQKALDAEVRTRMDVMALIANPMLGADQTALPRGFDMRVRPGKVWLTNSNPKEALYPVQFPNLDPASFSQTSEMERMVQMGTGAMDTATPLAENRRNETATGTSLIAGTFVKRSKRALRSITNNFLNPLIQKILWRRMDFDSTKYPVDVKFRVSSTLGIVAREIEQSQITTLLGLVADKPQTQAVLVQAMFDNSSSPYKAELTKALQADSQPTEEQKQMAELQKQAAQLEVTIQSAKSIQEQVKIEEQKAGIAKTMAEMKKLESDIFLNIAKIQDMAAKGAIDAHKAQQEVIKLQIELEEVRQFARQIDVSMLKVKLDANKGGSNGGKDSD